jgi:hypothetical protein
LVGTTSNPYVSQKKENLMAIDPKSISPIQRAYFLNYLQMLGGQPAVTAGLEVLTKIDGGQPLTTVPPTQTGITFQVPPQLLANVPQGAQSFGVPLSDIWKWILKLLECGLKNIALALQGKWTEFATAVLTCVLGS